jgi:hypothetical protein
LIKLPPDLSDSDRKTLEEIDQRHPHNPRQELAW